MPPCARKTLPKMMTATTPVSIKTSISAIGTDTVFMLFFTSAIYSRAVFSVRALIASSFANALITAIFLTYSISSSRICISCAKYRCSPSSIAFFEILITANISGSPINITNASRTSTASITAKISNGIKTADIISGSPCARYTSACSTSCCTIFASSPVVCSLKNPKCNFFSLPIICSLSSVSVLYARSCEILTPK